MPNVQKPQYIIGKQKSWLNIRHPQRQTIILFLGFGVRAHLCFKRFYKEGEHDLEFLHEVACFGRMDMNHVLFGVKLLIWLESLETTG